MSDNEITLYKTSSGELVEAGTTNLEQIDNKISEIEGNLTTLADHSSTAVKELLDLSIASQNPAYYEALAKLLNAAAKVNQTSLEATNAKANLYKENHKNNNAAGEGDNGHAGDTNITNNNLVVTTTDIVDYFLEKNKNRNGSQT